MRSRSVLRRYPLGSVLFVLFALVLTGGCGRGPDSEEPRPETETSDEPRRGGTLVSAFSGDISGLNELIVHTTTFNDYISFRLFLHLLEEQPDFTDHPPTFAPRLARSYEWSEDHKVLTFHLRDDVYWSDGVPVTAEDVRWTWQAQIHPDVLWEGRLVKEKITDVEVVDPHTVRFHYSQVYPAQLIHANEGVILPKHAWGRLPFSEWRTNKQWFNENVVTNGPFELESWKPDEELVLVRNEAYYEEGLPRLDRAVFRIVPDQTSQIAQVRAGNLDFISNVPPDDAGQLERTPGLDLKSYWGIGFIFIAWNNESPLFSDFRVRQALTMGIDRRGIVDALWGQYARVATSPIVDTVWAHNDSLEVWPYDPQRARELLEEVGWSDTDGDGIRDKDGRPFQFEILNHTGNRQREDATVIAQQQLREIGVSARPRLLDIGTFIPAVSQGQYEAAVEGITMSTDLNLRYLLHSDQIGISFNHARYRNPEVDELIDEAYRQKEQEDMAPYLMRIQELVHRDQPVTFLWFSQRLNVHNERIRDVRSNLLSPWYRLRYWWIDPQR